MALKAQWVNSLELGGVMVWSIEADDWRGDYGEAYPLVNTLKRIMNRCIIDSERSSVNLIFSPSGETLDPEFILGDDDICDSAPSCWNM